MKKLILFTFLATFLISCGSSKIVRQSKKIVKGDWLLETITYGEKGKFKVNLLDDASTTCFEGSSWHFIPNNNTGTYNMNTADCPTGNRYFIFTIQEVDKDTGLYDFLLKPTDEKRKFETNRGYRLQLKQLSDLSMQWEQIVSLEGKPFSIFMNFSKVVK